MRSIWQKQSGGLFRSECLISLCSITHFCRWSSRNVLLPFFVYLQDLNLRHEAPNAQHLAETVRGTVSQRVPYISVLDYAFLPVEQPECPASFFCLFARFELATRGSKCAAFGRNSPGDCFAASALYFCDRLLLSAGGAAGMSCFLFCLFTRFELATRGSKCVAFGRNSPGDCFAASALYLCVRLLLSAGGAALFLRRCSTYCITWSCQV